MNLLISAFIISNRYGSEESVSYRFLRELHESELVNSYDQIVVFTCDHLTDTQIKFEFPSFKFIFIGSNRNIAKIYYNQGNWIFYYHYLIYSFKVLLYSFHLTSYHSWHLNLVGFREPGFLFLRSKKHIWGPVSGTGNLKLSYIKNNWFKERIKSFLNFMQRELSIRIRLAAQKSSAIFYVSEDDRKYFKRKSSAQTELRQICEVAPRYNTRRRHYGDKKHVIWVGKNLPRKCLWIAILVAKKLPNVQFTFVGPTEVPAALPQNVKWVGRVDWSSMQKLYSEANILLMTSVQEATSTVCTEAIEEGLFIVAHEIGGIPFVVNDAISRLVPIKSPEHSIVQFVRAIEEIDLGALPGCYSRYDSNMFTNVAISAQFEKIKNVLIT